MKNDLKSAGYMRYTARSLLVMIAGICSVFALLSGSGELGGGTAGILRNLPNTLPWALLFIIVYIAWKWEFIGGVLIILWGLFTFFFFHTYESLITFFGISFPLLAAGALLIISSCLTRGAGGR